MHRDNRQGLTEQEATPGLNEEKLWEGQLCLGSDWTRDWKSELVKRALSESSQWDQSAHAFSATAAAQFSCPAAPFKGRLPPQLYSPTKANPVEAVFTQETDFTAFEIWFGQKKFCFPAQRIQRRNFCKVEQLANELLPPVALLFG